MMVARRTDVTGIPFGRCGTNVGSRRQGRRQPDAPPGRPAIWGVTASGAPALDPGVHAALEETSDVVESDADERRAPPPRSAPRRAAISDQRSVVGTTHAAHVDSWGQPDPQRPRHVPAAKGQLVARSMTRSPRPPAFPEPGQPDRRAPRQAVAATAVLRVELLHAPVVVRARAARCRGCAATNCVLADTPAQVRVGDALETEGRRRRGCSCRRHTSIRHRARGRSPGRPEGGASCRRTLVETARASSRFASSPSRSGRSTAPTNRKSPVSIPPSAPAAAGGPVVG